METTDRVIKSNVMSDERGLIRKKIREFFARFSKPLTKELIELQDSDDEIPDFLPPDPNNMREFKTGREMLQYAEELESKLQPKVRPNKNR